MEFLILLVVGGILWCLLWLAWTMLKIIFQEEKYAFVVRGDDSMLGGWEYEKYFEDEDEKEARRYYNVVRRKFKYSEMKAVKYQGKFDPDKTIFLEDYRGE